MHRLAIVVIVGVMAGCSGGHNLDSPIKTCKAVTAVLAGDKGVVWHGEQQS